MVADALTAQGWSVWWDRVIPPGKQFDEVIEEALDDAHCIVVLWSKSSVTSSWVKTECGEAMRRKVLVPILIEDVKIPLEFRRVQAANLCQWHGDLAAPELNMLFSSIANLVPRSSIPGLAIATPPVPEQSTRRAPVIESSEISEIAAPAQSANAPVERAVLADQPQKTENAKDTPITHVSDTAVPATPAVGAEEPPTTRRAPASAAAHSYEYSSVTSGETAAARKIRVGSTMSRSKIQNLVALIGGALLVALLAFYIWSISNSTRGAPVPPLALESNSVPTPSPATEFASTPSMLAEPVSPSLSSAGSSANDPEKQYQKGEQLYFGKGVTQNYAEAANWYLKAAEQGHAESQASLGFMYANGQGIARNDADAVKWYRKAAEQGLAWAQNDLARMYDQGRGVRKNPGEALKWYRKAAEQGNPAAQVEIATQFYVYSNFSEALKWYRKAAEGLNAEGQNNVGNFYRDGRVVLKDEGEAVKWYRKAAEQGDKFGQYNLGQMYENGAGVVKNYDEAVKWYQKAAEQGHESAQKALQRLDVRSIKAG